MSSLEVRGPSDDRHCGACTACCTYLAIPAGVVGEGHKASGVPCQHAGALGCRIHARRPRVCARFICEWLRDPLWPPTWRPDRAGVLCASELLEAGLRAAAVCEIQPGALLKPKATDIVNYLLRTTVAVAIIDAQRRRESILGRGEAYDSVLPIPSATLSSIPCLDARLVATPRRSTEAA